MINKDIPILLIEDDWVDIENAKRAFQKYQISNLLYTAKDGVDALDKLLGRNGTDILDPPPKIILLDINMPRMNGIDFLKEIRTISSLKSLIVFILTTSKHEKDIKAAYDLNIAGYIVKPVEFERFMKGMETLSLYMKLIEIAN